MISAKQPRSANTNIQIDHLRKRFELWRQAHKPPTRIPGRLWDSAVHVAAQCGLHRTARTLHLDYYALKKRLDGGKVTRGPSPSFIELRPPTCDSISECLIELEHRSGAKMRIHNNDKQHLLPMPSLWLTNVLLRIIASLSLIW
jgi:hypothetical protein